MKSVQPPDVPMLHTTPSMPVALALLWGLLHIACPGADLPVFMFAAEDGTPEFGGDWGLWPQQAGCRGTATFLPGQDAEGGAGGAMRIDYDIREAPRSFSLWLTPDTETVDLSLHDRFVVFAKGSVPSFTLVVKDRNKADPDEPDGIADCQVTGLTPEWQRFDVLFRKFVPRRKGAAIEWSAINHVGIALISPADRAQGTVFIDNLRAASKGEEGPAVAETAKGEAWEDNFDVGFLADTWQWRTPAPGPGLSLDARPGWLRIRIPSRPGGFNHWHEPTPVDDAPQLRMPAPPGNWELEARVQLRQFGATDHFLAGLVAGIGDDFLLTFGSFQAPTLPDGPKSPEVWFEPTGLSGFHHVAEDARDLRFRLRRDGSFLRASFSRDGKRWTAAGGFVLPEAPRFIGIIGKTFATAGEITFDVDNVKVTSLGEPDPGGRRAFVGVGGDYPTGYRGMLSRCGLPHEVMLDYQLADPDVLGRFDMVLIGSLSNGIAPRARDVLMDYIRQGGTALLDGTAYPPPSVVPGKGGRTKDPPDILLGGPHNPLTPLLGKTTRFGAGETRFHFEPASYAGMQILARYDGRPGSKEKPQAPYSGTPAIWAKPLGRGMLIYSAPSIGATLSWGPTHDALAEALVRYLAGGRLAPQLVEEGARLGRKQSVLTATDDAPATAEPDAATFERPSPDAPRGELPNDAVVVRSTDAAEFNVSGVYHPERGAARLLLNYWSPEYLVSIDFHGASAQMVRTENGKNVDTAEIPLDGTFPTPFRIRERRDHLVIESGKRRTQIRADRLWTGTLARTGAALEAVRFQPVTPPRFNDDFMRGEKERGAWEVVSGTWSVRATGDPKMGANPFTYLGHGDGTAFCMAGFPFWDDYSFEVSVKPTSDHGTVSQAFHVRDSAHCLLFRLRTAGSVENAKGGAEIVRLDGERETVLARGDACLVKGQWYRLSVRVQDGAATASVDGEPLVSAEDSTFPTGKVALCVAGGDAEFDDVAVRPVSPETAPALVELDGSVPRFAGTLDRDTWAGTALQWRADRETPGLFWRRGVFEGDVDLSFRGDFGDASSPVSMSLLLAPLTGTPEEGCALTVRPVRQPAEANQGDPQSRRYEVDITVPGVPAAHCSVTGAVAPVIELRREGPALQALLDGQQMWECTVPEPSRDLKRLGFAASGFRPRLSGLRLSAGNVLDTCFDHAPTSWWVGSGTWDLAVRWPCTPEWSWLAGESRQVAALWHKRSFSGATMLDLHVGPRTIDHGDGRPREICRAFNVALCGDGRDVRSGYSFVVGDGKDGAGAMLFRKGQVVAREPAYRIFSDAHNQWINVRAETRDGTVALWVGDQRVLSWKDPQPLPGGKLAVWTEDNGIMIPRATIFYAERP